MELRVVLSVHVNITNCGFELNKAETQSILEIEPFQEKPRKR